MAVHPGVETTLRVLERSKSTSAMTVLMHALTVTDPVVRDQAARSLIRTNSAIAKTEVIRNIERLSPEMIEELSADRESMSFPLQQCLSHGDQESSLKALQTIEAAQLYEQIPYLVTFLRTADGVVADRVEHVLLALTDQLYNARIRHTDGDSGQINQQCEDVVQVIGTELVEFEKLKSPRVLIEASLILGGCDHAVSRRLVRESGANCQNMVWDILSTSRHAGILRYLVESLKVKYVHPRIIEIVSRRRDVEFQLCLIGDLGKPLTVNQERNFCQLHPLPWLFPGSEIWKRIPAKWHSHLIRLVDAMSYKREQKVAFYESALEFGNVSAKRAAAQHRSLISPVRFERYVFDALEADEPEIEGWAVTELRNTTIAEKYRYLVNRLDSQCEYVRDMTREALGHFDVHNAIQYCEVAKPAVGPKISALLLKINPDALQDLSRELAHPVRTRRLRAVNATAFMHLQSQMTEALIEMLHDKDPIARRKVIEVLASVPTPKVVANLRLMRDDANPRVREAAQAALESLARVDHAPANLAPSSGNAMAAPAADAVAHTASPAETVKDTLR